MVFYYPCIDPTMHIPKDILPQFKFSKRALGKESKSNVLKWVFAMCAPHILHIKINHIYYISNLVGNGK